MSPLTMPPLTHRSIAFGAAAVLCLLAAARPMPAAAATNELAFSPASSSVGAASTVSVDITIANVTNLGGYNLHLQFNPAVVHLSSLADSGFVTNNPNNIVVCNTATIDNSAGTATDSCATSPFPPPGPGVSTTAPVALMHASFIAVAPGTSPLTLTGTTLLDPNGAALVPAPTLATGSIAVRLASVGGAASPPDLATLPLSDAATAHGSSFFEEALAGTLVVILVVLLGMAWRRKRG